MIKCLYSIMAGSLLTMAGLLYASNVWEGGYTDEERASMTALIAANQDDVVATVPRLSLADIGEVE